MILVEGFEEIEAVTIIDILRRAGNEVTTVYLKKNPITGSHAITILTDKNIDEISLSWVTISPVPVVRDGKVITGKGPGCDLPFALEMVAALSGKEAGEKLRDTMQMYGM